MSDFIISEEAAIESFNEWLSYYAIDFADIEIEDGPEAAKTMKNGLVRAIRRGELEVVSDTEGFKVVHRLKYPTEQTATIEYQDKIGKAKIASGSGKNNQERQYNFMSALCGVPVSELIKLKGPDASIFSRISTVFSMV